MKQILNKDNDRSLYWLLNALLITAILSFTCITSDDTKLMWPIIELTILAVLIGRFFEKLLFFPVLLSWLYLWAIVFNKNLYRRFLVTITIGILWVPVVIQGYRMFSSPNSYIVARNHWFFISSTVFMVSSLLLLYVSWRYQRK